MRSTDAPLKDELAGLWRYRVGDYRIICEIRDQQLLVLALVVGTKALVFAHHVWFCHFDGTGILDGIQHSGINAFIFFTPFSFFLTLLSCNHMAFRSISV
jgi:hypothetical protein